MKTKKQLTHWFLVIVIGIALGLGLQFVRAWTEPTAAPPNGNVGAPINTGAVDQSKAAVIKANDFCLNSDPTKCLSTVSGTPGTPGAPGGPGGPIGPVCGDRVCSGGETYSSCSVDCPCTCSIALECDSEGRREDNFNCGETYTTLLCPSYGTCNFICAGGTVVPLGCTIWD